MKGINISCTSENSIAIISSSMDPLPIESATSSSSSSSSSTVGGRAIDRYNPIITDERRRGAICKSATTTPCAANHSIKTPSTPLNVVHSNNSSPVETHRGRKKKTKKLIPRNIHSNVNIGKPSKSYNAQNIVDETNQVVGKRKSFSLPTDMMTKTGCTIARPGVDYISPAESSRYLLDDSSFLDMVSDFDPVLKLLPYDSKKPQVVASKSSNPSSSSSGNSDQVVVLRVSLHCRGCESKMKKHLSRMAGVTSFNIDFAAKKVTVVGDVTPLEVLASISKVKNAQLWTPATASMPINSRNLDS